MDAYRLLDALKVDLGIRSSAYDDRLSQYLEHARTEIIREGIALEDTMGDAQLVIMYAAWQWRQRDTGAGMPRMLRYALNNRLFSQKMRANG